MSAFEDGRPAEQPLQATPAKQQLNSSINDEENEACQSSNNNSIMGKVKLRVTSILPDSLSKWFSPTSGNDTQRHNGNAAGISAETGENTRKRSRRRIELETADAAEGFNVDDGAAAEGLNYEEVAIADNIAEHEYNVSLLRKLSYAGGGEDDDDDDDEEDDEEDERDQAGREAAATAKHWAEDIFKNVKLAGQPAAKRKRLLDTTELEQDTTADGWRRGTQFLASTPETGGSSTNALTGRNAPNRLGYMNLYAQNRQPAYNFDQPAVGGESARLTSNDVAASKAHLSSRRALNIPPSERSGYPNLPKYRRQALSSSSCRDRAAPWRSCTTINEDEASNDELLHNDAKRHNNNNNNNNNVFNVKRSGCFGRAETSAVGSGGTDTQSDCGSVESQPHTELPKTRSYNSNLDFYGNLQSRKSIYNVSNLNTERNAPHHISTLSLNSLSRRRRFNTFKYGSTSALSDSRLLSSSVSPFYQGRTAFGGSAANSRFLAQPTGAVPQNPSSISTYLKSTNTTGFYANYGMQPTEMRPKSMSLGSSNTSLQDHPGLSNTARRILNLLDNYSTPLIDAQKMGSTLREHQQQRNANRSLRNQTPYARQAFTADSAPAEQTPPSGLLVPTMQQLIERRRLQRVTQNPRDSVLIPNAKQSAARRGHELNLVKRASPAAANNNISADSAPPEQHQSHAHTNKLRSRLPHQTRKEAYNEERDQPLPLNLPSINFPKMLSTPKFDLVIPLPKASVTPTTSRTPCASSNGVKSNYQFEVPQKLHCSVPLQRAVPSRRTQNFVFTAPIPLDTNSTHFEFTASTTLDTSSTDKKAAVEATAPPVTAATNSGFGDLFKQAADQWECEVCMVRNKLSAAKCVACESPKTSSSSTSTSSSSTSTSSAPASSQQTPLTAAGFGDRFKQPANAWECEACMLSNKSEAAKCVACETPRKSSTAVSTSSESSSLGKLSNTFGDAFKRKASTWECSTCLIVNQQSSSECVACQTRNPQAASSTAPVAAGSLKSAAAAAPKSDSSFQQLAATQKSTSWECDACMAQNEMSRNKCICCEQQKPGSASTSKFSFGSSSAGQYQFGFPAAAASTPATKASTTTVFTFGNQTAPAAPVPAQTSSAVCEAKPANALPTGFSFGAPTAAPVASNSVANQAADDSAKTASSNMFNFAPAKTAALTNATATTTTAAGFTFGGAATVFTAATAKPVDTKAPVTSAASTNLFTFGSGASSTVSSSTPSFGAPKATMLASSSGINAVTSTAAAPMLVSTTATPTTMSKINFSADTTTTAAKSVPTTAVSSTTQPAARPIFGQASSAFMFGSGGSNQPAAAAAAASETAPAAAMPFLFGQPASTSAKTASNSAVNSIFGNPATATASLTDSKPTVMSSFGGASGATSQSNDVAATPTLPFTFGVKPAEPAAATTAAAATAAAAPAAISSASTGFVFSWPTAASNGGAAAANTAVSSSAVSSVFGSGSVNTSATGLFGNNSSSSNAPLPVAATPFGTAAPTSVFGASTAPTPMSNIMNSAQPAAKPFGGFGSVAAGGIGAGSSSTPVTTTTQPKTAFNFGSSVATSTTYPTIGSFNFNMANTTAGATGAGSAPKPAFNFTASPSTAQSTTFNFTANAANSTTNASGGGGGDSTSNAAPFQFSAAASAPVNIFAFNPPAGGSAAQSAHMVRRKIRAPIRRLPPR